MLASCGRNPLDVDIHDTQIELSFINLDSLIFNVPPKQLPTMRTNMLDEIPELFQYQIGYCLRIGQVEDTAFVTSIQQYRSDTTIQKLEQEIALKFKDLNNFKSEMVLALRRLKKLIPNKPTPTHIVFQNSLFSSGAFCTNKEIGIGLEQFLGKDNPIIKKLPSKPFFDWIKEGYNPDFMSRDAVLSWILTHVIEEEKGTIAAKMIYYGKAIYLTEACLPTIEKHHIIRYSQADYEWAIENEFSFWKYLIDEQILFKKDDLIEKNLMEHGPFTIGLPEKSPDRLGRYLGWQIVKHYMENSETSFEELMEMPYNEILQSYDNE